MQIFYYQAEEGNFGDDLNTWLWPNLIPDCWQKEDDTLFVGVGTVLNDALPKRKRNVVFGSGVGYQPFSGDIKDGSWDVYCVRGPLSARVLGLDDEKSVTDTALLVRDFYGVIPAQDREGVVFVPHISTVKEGKWREVCRKADIKYIDPRGDAEKIAEEISKATVVLADAMHAAIFADAMRVPWIPVVTTVEINTFKWLDWADGMDVPYRPIILSQSSVLERVKNLFFFLGGEVQTLFLETEDSKRQLNPPNNAHDIALSYYETRFLTKRAGLVEGRRKWVCRVYQRVIKPLLGNSVAQYLLSPFDRIYTNRAVKSLQQAAGGSTYLSEDELCTSKLMQLRSLLAEIKSNHASK